MFPPYRLPKLTGQWEERLLHLSTHLSQMLIGETKYILFNPSPLPPLPSQMSKSSRSSKTQPSIHVPVQPKILDVKQVFSAEAIARQIKGIFDYKHKNDRKKQRRHGAPLIRAGRKRSRFLGFGHCDDDTTSNTFISDMTTPTSTTSYSATTNSKSSSSYESDV